VSTAATKISDLQMLQDADIKRVAGVAAELYVLLCRKCGHRYNANGLGLWQRRCPACGGGAAGLAF
jgi:hypothetical protein